MQSLLNGEAVPGMEELKGKEPAVFSDVILDKFIKEDFRHGHSKLSGPEGRSLRTFSSGGKRKILLGYLIKQQPDFLVLDSPFDCLDHNSVEMLKKRLLELSANIPIIQLFSRNEDLLPFITEVFCVEEEKQIRQYNYTEFQQKLSNRKQTEAFINIPPAINNFIDVPEVLVEMKGVSVNYEGRPVLTNINWIIKKGEFWQLVGPNGSGKTTLLSMIYGDNPKAYGEELFLFGKKKGSGESVWDIKQKIGYFSPAITELFEGMHTIEQMLVSGLVDSIGLYQIPSDNQLSLARKWLKTLDLLKDKDKPFRMLPVLQQRLVLIARAMIKHPPLLILDEPSGSLDESSALVLIKLINIFAKESGTAVIYVSHRKEEGLLPDYTYKLIPGKAGFEGEVSNT